MSFRLALLVLVLSLFASACQQETPSTDVFCPINYDQVNEPCRINLTKNPDPARWEQLSAVTLGNSQIGIFRQPGDNPPQLVEGIGYHAVPAKYTVVIPTNVRTMRTERDTAAKCSQPMLANFECNTSLDNVRLKGGTQAIVDFEIDFRVLINTETVGQFASEFTSYSEFMDRFTRHLRSGFRNATAIDPALYFSGDINTELVSFYAEWANGWQFANLLDIQEIRIRGIEIEGIDTSAGNAQNTQQEQHASAFATQAAIACGSFTSEEMRAYCIAVYVWSQKGDDVLSPLLPPSTAPTTVAP